MSLKKIKVINRSDKYKPNRQILNNNKKFLHWKKFFKRINTFVLIKNYSARIDAFNSVNKKIHNYVINAKKYSYLII